MVKQVKKSNSRQRKVSFGLEEPARKDMDELTGYTDPPLELYAHFLRSRIGYYSSFVGNLVLLTTIFYYDVWHYLGMIWVAVVFTRLWVGTFVGLAPKRSISTDKKAVLITGCDSGFGNSLCKNLDKQGFVVYATFLDREGPGACELIAQCSERLRPLQMDVTSDQQVAAAVKTVEETLGDYELWAVVNNAGVGIYALCDWCSLDTFRQMHEVNTFGTVRVTKSFLHLLKKSRGRVVNVASLLGKLTWPGMVPYCMSKYSVIAFSDGLRQELHQWDVSVHVIMPMLYKTNISNFERIKTSMEKIWNHEASEAVQKEYGERYLQSFQKGLIKALEYGFEDIRDVVDEMTDAVMSPRPKDAYVPNGLTEFAVDIYQSMPGALRDRISLAGLPRHLAGKKPAN